MWPHRMTRPSFNIPNQPINFVTNTNVCYFKQNFAIWSCYCSVVSLQWYNQILYSIRCKKTLFGKRRHKFPLIAQDPKWSLRRSHAQHPPNIRNNILVKRWLSKVHPLLLEWPGIWQRGRKCLGQQRWGSGGLDPGHFSQASQDCQAEGEIFSQRSKARTWILLRSYKGAILRRLTSKSL